MKIYSTYGSSSGLSFEEREQLDKLNGPATTAFNSAYDDSVDALPPGEEAMFLSNAGGEMELCEDLMGKQ